MAQTVETTDQLFTLSKPGEKLLCGLARSGRQHDRGDLWDLDPAQRVGFTAAGPNGNARELPL
jgi:hypothetical protein